MTSVCQSGLLEVKSGVLVGVDDARDLDTAVDLLLEDREDPVPD